MMNKNIKNTITSQINDLNIKSLKKSLNVEAAITGIFVLVASILSALVPSVVAFVASGFKFIWEVFYAIWGIIASMFIGVVCETIDYLINADYLYELELNKTAADKIFVEKKELEIKEKRKIKRELRAKIKQEKKLKRLIAKYNKQKGKEYIVYGLE